MAPPTPSPSLDLSATQPLTTARLSLGNPSPTVSTRDHLAFQLDHALARDAVHTPHDLPLLLEGLRARNLPAIAVRSNAPNRETYLLRPDLGRTLHPDSIAQLKNSVILSEGSQPYREPQPKDPESRHLGEADKSISTPKTNLRIALILADGLSALALERHALPLLDALVPLFSPIPYTLSPVALATQARVALTDPIGHFLHADIAIMLIGERPGLSSPDSLGCYITWRPRPGRTDAERNCISNIRGDEGLSYAEAAHRIAHYLTEAQRLQTTGITLKDPAPQALLSTSKLETSLL